jgi:hypothetical protein
MLKIGAPREPYEIALPYGVAVTVKPLTSTGMARAQAAARRRLESLEGQYRERKEAGLPTDGLPDLDDLAVRDGLYHALLVQELAAGHIVAWSGVTGADGEGKAPITREAIVAVLDLYPVAERFFSEFTLRQVMLNAAKNASGLSAAGTSSRAEGRDTAGDAPRAGSPAPAEASA